MASDTENDRSLDRLVLGVVALAWLPVLVAAAICWATSLG